MKWLILFFSLNCEASELEIMRARSTSDLVKIQDQTQQRKRLIELCLREKDQMVLPVACLRLAEMSEVSADILCARAKPEFFLQAEGTEHESWPNSCQEAYLEANERKQYRENF